MACLGPKPIKVLFFFGHTKKKKIKKIKSKYYLRTKFQDGIDKPQKCRNVCYHPTHQQQSDFFNFSAL
jgi:hypothetical protein